MLSRRHFLAHAAAASAVATLGACQDERLAPVQEGRLGSSAWPGGSPRWRLALPEDARATVVALHGHGGSSRSWFEPPLAASLAQRHQLAVAAVDGGDTYWHARADGTDTASLVLQDLVPTVERAGAPVDRLGLTGFSMGGYGALLLATELPPERVLGVAAVSSALFLSEASAAPGAFDGDDDFEEHDVFDRVAALRRLPVWLACGEDDSFAEANRRLAGELPDAQTLFDAGGHDRQYLEQHWPEAMAFLADQLRT